MNKKELKQFRKLCVAISRASEAIYRGVQAAKRATKRMNKLCALVEAAKKKHGLTDR